MAWTRLSNSALSFFSLVFLRRPRKSSKTPRIFSPCEPFKTQKNTQKTLKKTKESGSKKNTQETKHQGKEGQGAQGNKKYPRILGPGVHLALRVPQPREAYILQKKNPRPVYGTLPTLPQPLSNPPPSQPP